MEAIPVEIPGKMDAMRFPCDVMCATHETGHKKKFLAPSGAYKWTDICVGDVDARVLCLQPLPTRKTRVYANW